MFLARGTEARSGGRARLGVAGHAEDTEQLESTRRAWHPAASATHSPCTWRPVCTPLSPSYPGERSERTARPCCLVSHTPLEMGTIQTIVPRVLRCQALCPQTGQPPQGVPAGSVPEKSAGVPGRVGVGCVLEDPTCEQRPRVAGQPAVPGFCLGGLTRTQASGEQVQPRDTLSTVNPPRCLQLTLTARTKADRTKRRTTTSIVLSRRSPSVDQHPLNPKIRLALTALFLWIIGSE